MTTDEESVKLRRAGFVWAGIPGIKYPDGLRIAPKSKPSPATQEQPSPAPEPKPEPKKSVIIHECEKALTINEIAERLGVSREIAIRRLKLCPIQPTRDTWRGQYYYPVGAVEWIEKQEKEEKRAIEGLITKKELCLRLNTKDFSKVNVILNDKSCPFKPVLKPRGKYYPPEAVEYVRENWNRRFVENPDITGLYNAEEISKITGYATNSVKSYLQGKYAPVKYKRTKKPCCYYPQEAVDYLRQKKKECDAKRAAGPKPRKIIRFSDYEIGACDKKDYITAQEAMRVLGVSRSTLTRLSQAGRVKSEKRIVPREACTSAMSFFTRESVRKLKQERGNE